MQEHAQTLLEAEKAPLGKQNSVLIVEDDATQVEVLSYRLRNQGFQTLTADLGRRALSIARRQLPQLILLDLRLPDMDGFEVCEQLADDPATCTIPIIMLSGMERPDIVRCARAVGCQYYVHKPYDPNALLILINSALGDLDR